SRPPPPPPSPLFPYTTLFRSCLRACIFSRDSSAARIAKLRRLSRASASAPAVLSFALDNRDVLRSRYAGAASYATLSASAGSERSEEHTSELQSRFDLVCRLL